MRANSASWESDVRLRLTPREDSFFQLFAEAANNLTIAARLMVDLISDTSDREQIAEKMRACEHLGDDKTHAIMRRLNESFITPFDREDIYRLASNLDDVMDFMEGAAELTAEAMPNLRGFRNLSEYWIEINRLENQADQVYRRLVAKLFSGDYDALTVLKLKEVVDQLENAADAFEHVANTVEAITIKES